jgi:release factor glutamine methyltransferase
LQSVAAPTAVDLCSGSGALALALADEVPGARVLAIEQSGTALTWLRRNAAGTSVEVIVSDVRERGLLAGLSGVVDAVVCNPPYVPQGTRVAPEVRHDPDVAVFADDDGLELIPAVAATAAALLRPDGVLALEHDDSHGDAVARLLDAAGDWTEIEEHLDLTGRPRYVTARRR